MARHYRFSLRIASALVLFSGVFLFSGIGRAEDPLFTVDGVKVDVTAESAVAARGQAFEKAQQEAFKMLAERLLPEADAKTFEPPAVSTISRSTAFCCASPQPAWPPSTTTPSAGSHPMAG